jgi:selenide, water dikinase
MAPIPGVRLILISDGADTPYSGMLPGHVAGLYSHGECHIDLRSLCQRVGAMFYHDRVVGLDLAARRVTCADRPAVGFDLLSIDIGSTPAVVGCAPEFIGVNTIPAKPVPQFLAWWNRLCQGLERDTAPMQNIAIVGGGLGGIELAINMQQRLQRWPGAVKLHLFHSGERLLADRAAQLSQRLGRLLNDRGIALHLNQTVTGWDGRRLTTETGDRGTFDIAFDATVWVTAATAPDWLGASGLAVDDRGFIQVDATLQSRSHANIFAAGDIATIVGQPRPKAGVFAVRQGKPLAENLTRSLLGQSLQPLHLQRRYLSLLGLGDRRAIALWDKWGAELPGLWRLKDRIDRRFMAQFAAPTAMLNAMSNAMSNATAEPMRCSGCGAKVGASVLSRVMARLAIADLDQPDDAAVLAVPAGQHLVQTVDYFPAIVDDPYLFGQIAANHALSDLFAMGATAHSALAIVALPEATDAIQEEMLFQLLSGALKILAQTSTQLIGGHTIVADQFMFGLSCNGFATADKLWRKTGMPVGETLILTKALGTGALFAAQMQGQAQPSWIDRAIAGMQQSNATAAQILRQFGATACTDVTGFGLIGHLVEMLKPTPLLQAQLQISQIPLLAGAIAMTQAGIRSSLYPQNAQAAVWVNADAVGSHPALPLLYDPQTAGGLLATVPADRADDCLKSLQQAGYPSAAIGTIARRSDAMQPAIVLNL